MQMQDKDIESIKVVEEGVLYILKTPSCNFNSGHALFSSVLDITTRSLSKIENISISFRGKRINIRLFTENIVSSPYL